MTMLLAQSVTRRVVHSSQAITQHFALSTSYRNGDGPGRLIVQWPRLEARYKEICNDHGQLVLLRTTQKPQQHQTTGIVSQNMMNDGNKKAAVLVLLICVDDRPSLVFTQRSAHLSQHASQISFPGGYYDDELDGNNGLIYTALREAKEELYHHHDQKESSSSSSINSQELVHDFWNRVKILGEGTPLPSIRGVPVYPIFAAIVEENFSSARLKDIWPGNPSEVDQVFTVPVCTLLSNETTHELVATKFNPAIPRAPAFPTDHGTIWGLTAYILQPALHQLFGPILCTRLS